MTPRLDRFRDFLAWHTSIALDTDRDYMIDARLTPILRMRKLDSLETLLDTAMAETDLKLTQSVIEAMLNGESFFFRDKPVFDSLREKILPELLEARKSVRQLRIWCAACSTGQEPYSIAMMLDEESRVLRGWNIEILATDLSETAIEIAKAGYYNQFEVQRGLPINLLLRYFHRDQERWRIAEHLRSSIEFRQKNLKERHSDNGMFDIILCRNVLMYFNAAAKRDTLDRLSSKLQPDGLLLLGATENTSGLGAGLEPDLRLPGGYRPAGAAAAAAKIRNLMPLRA